MMKKKKTAILVIALILALSVVFFAWAGRNKNTDKETEGNENAILSQDATIDSTSEENDTQVGDGGNTEIQNMQEEMPEASVIMIGGTIGNHAQYTIQTSASSTTEQPTTQASASLTTEQLTTQVPVSSTMEQPTTQAPVSSTMEQPTPQTPTTTEQPSGGNGGNGGNTHQHTWEAQYQTVHHDEEGHYENVCVKKAYDEAVYEGHYVCNYCGKDITASGEGPAHCIACGPPLSEDDIRYVPGIVTMAGSSYGTIRIQVDTIHHEAVYEKKWIVDKKAYDEQVLKGYKCTVCGATK